MKTNRKWGIAWVVLAVALAIHVIDEAVTGFLPFYNSLIRSIPNNWSWIPLPTFTFQGWIAGLIVGIALMFALSPLFFAGRRFMLPLAYFLGVLMVGNGLGHIGASFYLGNLAPGVMSAPVLLVAAGYLLFATHRLRLNGA